MEEGSITSENISLADFLRDERMVLNTPEDWKKAPTQ